MTQKIQSINPYNQELNAEFELLTDAEITEKIELAHQAYLEWKVTPKSEKKKLFLSLADTIESDLEPMAKLQTIEMGMLYNDSVNGLKKTISLIRWFAGNFERILADEEFEEEGTKGKYQYDPI
jgi:succinate-semialdehyde dehydrogenase / glutarate-semialdehyde dehydrogenase